MLDTEGFIVLPLPLFLERTYFRDFWAVNYWYILRRASYIFGVFYRSIGKRFRMETSTIPKDHDFVQYPHGIEDIFSVLAFT